MKKSDDFSQYFLYRWRYAIGYGIIGLLLVSLLLLAALISPGGLSVAEKASATTSAALSFSSLQSLVIPNLPYHLLQAGSFALFGISEFSIKLPSLLLGLAAAVGFIILLRRWFTLNVAVLASLIAVATGQFLFIAQSGTPDILYIFWPIVILLLGTQVTRGLKWRFAAKIAFVIAVSLSLYSPLSIYPLLAVILTTVLHPHLRATLRKLPKQRLAIISAIGVLLLAPLIIGSIQNPSLGLTLLGLPESWPPNILDNALAVVQQYFMFWSPSASAILTPVFGLGSVLIMTIGLYRLVRTRETTRSYLIILWSIMLIPVLLLNPAFTSVSFVPSMLMLAAGLTSLIGYWYRLFPRNPYARIGGLIPIVILVGALISTGVIRYAYGYHYTPVVANLFSKDLSLLPEREVVIRVAASEKPFYDALAKYRQDLWVSTEIPVQSGTFIETRAARSTTPEGYRIESIITNSFSGESDRFYVYKKDTK